MNGERRTMKILIFIIAVPVFLFFSERFLEHKSLYFPYRAINATPEDIGLEYEDINIRTRDGIRLSTWFIPSEDSRAVLLFCHGNGGNISHRLAKLQILNKLNLSVLIYDYRGYGRSKGSPDEEGIYLDAETVYDYLVNKKGVSPESIIAFGESLGAAVSADLALKHDIKGVIIEEGFPSVKAVGMHYFPFIPNFIYKSKYDTKEKLKSLKAPKLIFHSIDDEIIPFDMGKRLFEAAAEPKEFIELRGGHNDAFMVSQELFVNGIDAFVDGLNRE
jgi:fermentation-respiration switch protein FrsA (DUF1100 family)